MLVLAIAGPDAVSGQPAGRVAVAGLAGLAAWSAVSLAWAPLVGPAVDSVQRLLLYLGALLAAVALLRPAAPARPSRCWRSGALVVIGYGLRAACCRASSICSDRSYGAGGRLEQPITYWNAEGLLAAMGLLLCVRMAGDTLAPAAMRVPRRPPARRSAWACTSPTRAGRSRSPVSALIVLLAAAPTWPQLRAAGVGLGGRRRWRAACRAAFPGVASLSGDAGRAGARRRDLIGARGC